MEIPGELGSLITNRVVAISCNECPTEELRMKCGCVGNTGFNTVSQFWSGTRKWKKHSLDNSSWSPLQRLKDTKKLIKQYSERYQRIVLIDINYMFKQSSNNLQILTESKDRFLDWAAKHLPPSERPRRIAVVEESYLVRRVAATVLGRLKGFGTPTVHNHTWCPWCELFTFAYSFKDVVDS